MWGKLDKIPYRGLLIGKRAVVASSANPGEKGITGTIIDETRNTLKIKKEGGRIKSLFKKNIVISLPEENKKIIGKEIIKRQEERMTARK